MPAKAQAEWKGDLKSGSGTFTAGDGGIWRFLVQVTVRGWPRANPEQLIGAAHASCFSMALSAALGEAGHPVDSVRTDATVTLRIVDATPRSRRSSW